MAFTIYSTITLLTVIYCTVRPKILNSLELTTIFLLVMYLDSNMMDLITLNIKGIIISKKSSDLFAYFLTFIVLYPLIISCSLDHIRKIQAKLGKVFMIMLAVFAIVGLEQGLKYFKVLIYQNWSWSFDFIQWLCIYLITYFLHSLFRNFVLKELNR